MSKSKWPSQQLGRMSKLPRATSACQFDMQMATKNLFGALDNGIKDWNNLLDVAPTI